MQQNEIKNTHSKLFGIRQLFRLEFKNRRQRNFGYSSRNFRRRRVPLVLIVYYLAVDNFTVISLFKNSYLNSNDLRYSSN